MTNPNNAPDWTDIAKLLATALGAIDQIIVVRRRERAEGLEGSPENALTAIGAIVEMVKNGDIESIDPTVAHEELQMLIASIGSNDSTAGLAVEAKFDTSDS